MNPHHSDRRRGVFRRGRRRESGAPDALLREIGFRLRGLMSAEGVMEAAAEACVTALGARESAIWLSTGREEPRLAYRLGGSKGAVPPREVYTAIRRRRTVVRQPDGLPFASMAVPLLAPRAGVLGALFIQRDVLDAGEVNFGELVAQETALALETANIYEQAVAARDRSEALLARVADAIVVTDTRGRVLHTNEAAKWILEQPFPRGRPIACGDALALHADERALDCSTGCALLALAPPDKDTSEQEVWRRRADGSRQPMLANTSVVADADGVPMEIVHSLRDITRLKQADEAKTLFLATASHELKTPLTVIQGFSEMLAAQRFTTVEQREEAALAIQRRAVQLNKIVDRLLLSSRIETGRVDLQIGEVALMPIVTERIQALHTTSGRELVADVSETPPSVAGDAAGVTTVIDHLLDNAVKYSPSGGEILLGVRADADYVFVTVRDAGIGMDPEQASHCFEKFWQAESTDARRFQGTGIGLYIVRSLVEAMGGRVSVETSPGKGSAFVVQLRRWGVAPPAREPERQQRHMAPEPSVIREFMRQIGIPDGKVPR